MGHKDAVAVIGRAGISHPAQGLRQRPAGVSRLPAAGESELIRESIQDVAFTLQHSHRLVVPPIPNRNIEVTTENQICASGKRKKTIENVV
jgi:hypothetical protein